MVAFMLLRAILSLIPGCKNIWQNSTPEAEAGAEKSRQVGQIRITQNVVETEASLLEIVEELKAKLHFERLKNNMLWGQERERRISQENTDRIQRRLICVLKRRELQWQESMREAREKLAAFETPSLDMSPTPLTSAENITTRTGDQNRIFMPTVLLNRCEPRIRLSHCHDPLFNHPEHVVVDGENVILSGGKANKDNNILSLVNHYQMKKQYPLVVLMHFRVNKRNNKDGKWGIAEKLSSSLNGNWQVIPVPINADDDMYAINLAKNIDAIIVSNDKFRKQISEQETPEKQEELAKFVKEKRVRYTFKKGKYYPY
ncbi:unnamed protein product [Chondrus crispus]|uniref:RNase NYN domain-containing protein n=1 Tax=Chondrus crispus TaxID=2769 RepID=R7Q554_CHOCR|nr:unnamed protein product [Chondrus crispus]CDF32590.1 unnamed protein product [Chondrus crispus]|eukprot:XP_005712361.1 unnamed protein product [Chondrus crispus]